MLSLLGAASCGPRWERSDDAVLTECWNAVRQPENGRYQLRFGALVIVDDHHGGGVYARSMSCPDHRLRFHRMNPDAARQLAPIKKEADRAEGLGLAIRGSAIVTPFKRMHEHHLQVRVITFRKLEAMTPSETRQFVERFNIG